MEARAMDERTERISSLSPSMADVFMVSSAWACASNASPRSITLPRSLPWARRHLPSRLRISSLLHVKLLSPSAARCTEVI